MATPDGRGKDALATPDACGASPGRHAKQVPGAHGGRARERECSPLLKCKVAVAPVRWPWQGGMRARRDVLDAVFVTRAAKGRHRCTRMQSPHGGSSHQPPLLRLDPKPLLVHDAVLFISQVYR